MAFKYGERFGYKVFDIFWVTENGIRYSIITDDEIKDLKSGETVVLPKILYCKDSMYYDLKKV